MNSADIRQKFLKFFEKRGHVVIPSASLIAFDERGVTDATLFNTSGMQPLVPYLLGEEHPKGKRLVNVQKCLRTIDIDEVGDNTHLTFFEMLGNWSLGDYFKEESIKWSYELLTDKEEGFGLDPKRLYITVFGGNADAPQDNESFEIWKKYVPENRIYFLTWNGKKEPNWWDAGENGPAGPDTEIFYDLTGTLGDMTKEEYLAADERQDIVEIWNNVFMEYLKKDGKVIGKLSQKNVDTGAGLERWATVLQEKKSVFETDLFAPLMSVITEHTKSKDEVAKRIIADHVRAAVFMISDGVVPSNTAQGYVLRKLIRRARYYLDSIDLTERNGGFLALAFLASTILELYKGSGYSFDTKKIDEVISTEEIYFHAHMHAGKKTIEKIMKEKGGLSGEDIFLMYSTYGYPFELIKDIAQENNIKIDEDDFLKRREEHKRLSQAGAEQKFKGGLAGHSEMEVKYHTATHLLHQALHDVLGEEVGQKGSNITPERLRFDFSFPRKMTDEEKKRVEEIINEKISAALPVHKVVMLKAEAKKTGARHFFGEKYPDEVSVYYIGASLEDAYSKEFCGGPHVENIGTLGTFKILKEEAVSAGVRRIKAVLE